MLEYFDVLDENRNFLHKTLPRGTKLAPNEFNQGAEAWILSKDNKILITQRSKLKSHPLMWEAPGGCTIAGENTSQTIIRELQEELGLDINLNSIKLIDTKLYKYQFVDIFIVTADFELSSLQLQSSEIAAAQFVSFDEMEKLIKDNQIVPCTLDHYDIVKNYIKENH